jgi:hypothetical protein
MNGPSPHLSFLMPPCEMEAKLYYAGLPSKPVLVARTGIPWEAPTGPEENKGAPRCW